MLATPVAWSRRCPTFATGLAVRSYLFAIPIFCISSGVKTLPALLTWPSTVRAGAIITPNLIISLMVPSVSFVTFLRQLSMACPADRCFHNQGSRFPRCCEKCPIRSVTDSESAAKRRPSRRAARQVLASGPSISADPGAVPTHEHDVDHSRARVVAHPVEVLRDPAHPAFPPAIRGSHPATIASR